MKQNNNHIYRVITVRQIVLDSDIAIYKPRVIPCSSVDRLVIYCEEAKYFFIFKVRLVDISRVALHTGLYLLWEIERYFYCINSEGYRRSEEFISSSKFRS